MKKQILFIGGILQATILALLLTLDAKAQYNTAVGLRIGGTSGVAVKHFYKPRTAVEGIIGAFGNGVSLTGLVEKFMPVDNAEGLHFYYGGGLHVAAYNGRANYYSYFGRDVDSRTNDDVGFGINGILGLEYRLPDNIPMAISIDLKPFVEMGTGGYVSFAPDPSIGIKFILK